MISCDYRNDILLHDPASLGDDVLEGCLYILRERLLELQKPTA